MLPRPLLLLLLTCACAQGQVFTPGTSLESVQSALGPAQAKVEDGSKEVLVYADGTRLEFIDGKLISPDNLPQSSATTPTSQAMPPAEPLIRAENIVAPREQQTISANSDSNDIDFTRIAENSRGRQILAGLEADLQAENNSQGRAQPQQRLKEIALGFAIELLITLLLLNITFQVSGFTPGQGPLILLSLALALVGALLDTLIQAGPFHPVRAVAGFAVLLVLIPALTPARKWAGALKIAAVVRIASTLCFWLLQMGLAGLLTI